LFFFLAFESIQLIRLKIKVKPRQIKYTINKVIKMYPYNDQENPVGLNIHLTNGAIIKKAKKNLNTHIPTVIIKIASCRIKSCINYFETSNKMTHNGTAWRSTGNSIPEARTSDD